MSYKFDDTDFMEMAEEAAYEEMELMTMGEEVEDDYEEDDYEVEVLPENNVGTTLRIEDVWKKMAKLSREKHRYDDKKGKKLILTQKMAHEAILFFRQAVEEALRTGQTVKISGFVNFEPKYRVPHEGFNIATGEKMIIPGCLKVAVTPGQILKNSVKYMPEEVKKSLEKEYESKVTKEN